MVCVLGPGYMAKIPQPSPKTDHAPKSYMCVAHWEQHSLPVVDLCVLTLRVSPKIPHGDFKAA